MKLRPQHGYILVPAIFMLALLAVVAYLINTDSVANLNLGKQQVEAQRAHYIAEAGLAHAAWLASQQACAGYNLSNTPFREGSYSATFVPNSGSPVSISAVGTLANGAMRNLSRDSVKVYDLAAARTRILQPGSEGKDTFIEGESGHTGHNKGDHDELKTSSLTGKEYRALVQFDLPALPPGAMVHTATLELYLQSSGSSDVVKAHRLLRDWTENGATWEDYNGVNSWNKPGGDYDSDVAGSFLADGTGRKSMDITAVVQEWITGAQPNYGLILLSAPSPSGNENKYHSSDKSGEPQPKLTITYACECGVDCGPPVAVCDGNYAADVQVGSWNTTPIGTALNDMAYVPGGVTINGETVPADGGWAIVEDTSNDVTVTDLNGVEETTFTVTPTSVTGFTAIHYISNGTSGPGLLLANVDTALSTTEYIIVDLNGAIDTSWSHSSEASGVAWLDAGSYQGHFLTVNSTGAGELFDDTGTSVGTLTLPPEIVEAGALVHLPDGNLVAVQDASSDTVWIMELSGNLPNLTASTRSSFDVNQFGISNFNKGISLNPVNCNYALLSNSNETVLVNQTGATGSLTLAPVEDTHIYEGSGSTNYGSSTQVRVGKDNTGPAGRRWRGLVKFDENEIANSLPSGATVTAATLRLYQESAVSTDTITMDVHKITANWAEGSITWDNSSGGSFNATAEDTATVVLGTQGWTEWSLPVTLVTDWMDVPSDNYGLLVDTNGGKNRRADFVSRGHMDTTRHPQLVIEYTAP